MKKAQRLKKGEKQNIRQEARGRRKVGWQAFVHIFRLPKKEKIDWKIWSRVICTPEHPSCSGHHMFVLKGAQDCTAVFSTEVNFSLEFSGVQFGRCIKAQLRAACWQIQSLAIGHTELEEMVHKLWVFCHLLNRSKSHGQLWQLWRGTDVENTKVPWNYSKAMES